MGIGGEVGIEVEAKARCKQCEGVISSDMV